MYRKRFPDRQHPNPGLIRNIEIRSRRENFLRLRRRWNELGHENNPRFIAVLDMVHLDPYISLQEIESLGVPTSNRYLPSVKCHRYHITLNQALVAEDHLRRMRFCE